MQNVFVVALVIFALGCCLSDCACMLEYGLA